MGKKIQIFLLLGVLVIIGTFLNTSTNPLLWGTGAVIELFLIILFGIDPLSPRERNR